MAEQEDLACADGVIYRKAWGRLQEILSQNHTFIYSRITKITLCSVTVPLFSPISYNCASQFTLCGLVATVLAFDVYGFKLQSLLLIACIT